MEKVSLKNYIFVPQPPPPLNISIFLILELENQQRGQKGRLKDQLKIIHFLEHR